MTEECSGACEEHIEEIQYVHVEDPRTGMDWGKFYYCQAAIECDTKNGLIVTILEE
jgi:hypothetical protein